MHILTLPSLPPIPPPPSPFPQVWARDLKADLTRLRDHHGVTTVVCLLNEAELRSLKGGGLQLLKPVDGAVQLNPADPYSFNAPGDPTLEPIHLQYSDILVSSLCFHMGQLVPLYATCATTPPPSGPTTFNTSPCP
jgi:hypothetical protein